MVNLQELNKDLSQADVTHQCVQGNTVYVKQGSYPISDRKLQGLKNIAMMQKFYQCNPVRFISDWFNIELLDAQAWIIQRSWTCPNVLLLCTRGFGKSTVIDLMLMAKSMLFNNYWSYIASGSGGQAEQTFTTLEKLAHDNIDTMIGSTGKNFLSELVIRGSAGDGFNHSASGFNYELYNGSTCKTLNSNVDSRRGARGNVIFDEASFLPLEMLQIYGAFAIVNKSFKSGKDRDGNRIDPIRLRCIPDEVPNQLFYISSASSTDTPYYQLYRDFAKKQLVGDPNFFVAQIDCEVAFKPTIHGEVMQPLLSRSTVEAAMRNNSEKALREYYCQFTTSAGSDAIIRRGTITRNEEIRVPLLRNDTGNKKFIISYDPARSRDNSVILVSELYEEEDSNGRKDLRIRLVNLINLMDTGKHIKSPMRTPDQVEYLKKVIVDYNGGAPGYSNIVGVFIDAGSGGGGVNIADYLMPDWTDENGVHHDGLIDKTYSADYVSRFPNAVDKVRLIKPSEYKSVMYEALIELANQDKIKFTAPYDGRGYLTMFDVDENVIEKKKSELRVKYQKLNCSADEIDAKVQEDLNKMTVGTKTVKLTWEEELALVNIDALKEELVNMVRKKRDSGKDSFELTPEKVNKLHDDRAYTLCLAAYALMCERRKLMLDKPKRTSMESIVEKLTIRRGRFGEKII